MTWKEDRQDLWWNRNLSRVIHHDDDEMEPSRPEPVWIWRHGLGKTGKRLLPSYPLCMASWKRMVGQCAEEGAGLDGPSLWIRKPPLASFATTQWSLHVRSSLGTCSPRLYPQENLVIDCMKQEDGLDGPSLSTILFQSDHLLSYDH